MRANIRGRAFTFIDMNVFAPLESIARYDET